VSISKRPSLLRTAFAKASGPSAFKISRSPGGGAVTNYTNDKQFWVFFLWRKIKSRKNKIIFWLKQF
jgi:hypothetical protein